MVWPPEPGDDPMTAHLVVPREKWFKTPATFIYVLLALILPQNNRSSQLRVWCLLCQGLPDHVQYMGPVKSRSFCKARNEIWYEVLRCSYGQMCVFWLNAERLIISLQMEADLHPRCSFKWGGHRPRLQVHLASLAAWATRSHREAFSKSACWAAVCSRNLLVLPLLHLSNIFLTQLLSL